jgi:hypothetical protein
MRIACTTIARAALSVLCAASAQIHDACGVDVATGRAKAAAADSIALPATGWFRTRQAGARWLLIDADGRPFYSLGVSHVTPQGYADPAGRKRYEEIVLKKYGTQQAWAVAQTVRFQAWGINTVGAFSDYPLFADSALAFTAFVKLSDENTDFWDPAWARDVVAKLDAAARTYGNNKRMIGYFTDNELSWTSILQAPGTAGEHYMLGKYLQHTSAGKAVLSKFLQRRYASVNAFAADFPDSHLRGDSWSALDDPGASLGSRATPGGQATAVAWAQVLARRYFSVTDKALRAADSHHMNLGVKFIAQTVPLVVLQEAARHVDVIAVDFYEPGPGAAEFLQADSLPGSVLPTAATLAQWYRATGRPILIAEFGYRAADAGLPNSSPPMLPVLANQHERAARVGNYLQCAFEAPYILGAHLFEFADEPAAGRFDGENSNWGLVSEADDPYQEVADAFAAAHARAYERLSNPAAAPAPCDPVGPQK